MALIMPPYFTCAMNIEPVKRAVKHLCLWLVLVGVVLLFTLLFNFFGTLTCAALTAMMLGAVRHRRWLSVPIAAVFPGVIFALMYFSKVELEGSKRIVVPALCFGLFWVTYGVTHLMMGSEAKYKPSQTKPPTVTKQAEPLRLDQLQGRWRYETADHDGQVKHCVIEITQGHLVLSEFDDRGRRRLRVESDIRLVESGLPRETVASKESKPIQQGS